MLKDGVEGGEVKGEDGRGDCIVHTSHKLCKSIFHHAINNWPFNKYCHYESGSKRKMLKILIQERYIHIQ